MDVDLMSRCDLDLLPLPAKPLPVVAALASLMLIGLIYVGWLLENKGDKWLMLKAVETFPARFSRRLLHSPPSTWWKNQLCKFTDYSKYAGSVMSLVSIVLTVVPAVASLLPLCSRLHKGDTPMICQCCYNCYPIATTTSVLNIRVDSLILMLVYIPSTMIGMVWRHRFSPSWVGQWQHRLLLPLALVVGRSQMLYRQDGLFANLFIQTIITRIMRFTCVSMAGWSPFMYLWTEVLLSLEQCFSNVSWNATEFGNVIVALGIHMMTILASTAFVLIIGYKRRQLRTLAATDNIAISTVLLRDHEIPGHASPKKLPPSGLWSWLCYAKPDLSPISLSMTLFPLPMVLWLTWWPGFNPERLWKAHWVGGPESTLRFELVHQVAGLSEWWIRFSSATLPLLGHLTGPFLTNMLQARCFSKPASKQMPFGNRRGQHGAEAVLQRECIIALVYFACSCGGVTGWHLWQEGLELNREQGLHYWPAGLVSSCTSLCILWLSFRHSCLKGGAAMLLQIRRFCCLRPALHLVGTPLLLMLLDAKRSVVLTYTDELRDGLVVCVLVCSDTIVYFLLDLSLVEILTQVVTSLISYALLWGPLFQDDLTLRIVTYVHSLICICLVGTKVIGWSYVSRKAQRDEAMSHAAADVATWAGTIGHSSTPQAFLSQDA